MMVSPFLVNGPNSEGATVQFVMAHSGAESGFIEIFLMEMCLAEKKQKPKVRMVGQHLVHHTCGPNPQIQLIPRLEGIS